jgi:hypothetical protein
VHGSSISGRPTFDLSVPGHGEYSLMNKFAEYRFDVWTMDFSGYGRSSVGEGNSNIADSVEDLKAAVEVGRAKLASSAIIFSGNHPARFAWARTRWSSRSASAALF